MKDISELNRLFLEAESVDQAIFAEMRSNILLVAGDHYTKRKTEYWSQFRDSAQIPGEIKIRLTMNHLGRIVKGYVNDLITYAPGVSMRPKNKSEMQDVKAADQHQAVWNDAKERHDLEDKVFDWANDFEEIGECHAYLYFDPNAGEIKGYEPQLDEAGEPIIDELGQPIPDQKKPVKRGDFVFKKLYGFNVLRNTEAQSFDEADGIIREMGKIADLKKKYEGDEKKLSYIQPASKGTFRVYDATSGEFRSNKETECQLRTYLFRPCAEYPKGYFYLTTEYGILEEGELPFGIYPLVSEVCEKIQTSCRGRSPIKQWRPIQAEINRASSKQAEHQMTVGDDKLVLYGKSKATSGIALPGIRTVNVDGPEPTILEGRTGNQYVDYVLQKIEELYRIADYPLDDEKVGEVDPHALLYKAGSQRKKRIRHTKRFQRFLKNLAMTYLRLAKNYFDDDMFIRAVGRNEAINIAEFKSAEDLAFEIVVEDSNEDVETKMGRQLIMSQTLQYVGSKLPEDVIGEILRAMPYGNFEKAFKSLTWRADRAENMLLALDRGSPYVPFKYDDAPYMIQRLIGRMAEGSFEILPDQIKAAYEEAVATYEEIEAQKQREIMMAKNEMIPVDGPRVKVDFYVNDPMNPNKTVRASLPSSTIEWVLEKLNQQGMVVDATTTLPVGAQAEIAQMSTQQTAPQEQL